MPLRGFALDWFVEVHGDAGLDATLSAATFGVPAVGSALEWVLPLRGLPLMTG